MLLIVTKTKLVGKGLVEGGPALRAGAGPGLPTSSGAWGERGEPVMHRLKILHPEAPQVLLGCGEGGVTEDPPQIFEVPSRPQIGHCHGVSQCVEGTSGSLDVEGGAKMFKVFEKVPLPHRTSIPGAKHEGVGVGLEVLCAGRE